jgi:type 1 glutamine amidotransferase
VTSVLHLLISGGIYHEFQASSALLARELADLGFETRVFEEPEAALAALATGPRCDLLTINALRFSMQQHPKYQPLRAQWAFELSASGRATLAGYVRDGGALLGLHTASICFDGWDEWPAILGASWTWGRSFHAPVGAVEVRSTEPTDPITSGLPQFQVLDEVYRGLRVSAQTRPLLQARCQGEQEYHPVLWAHQYGAGRVIYDALGHGPESLGEATHLEILRRAARWLIAPPHRIAGRAHA